MLNGDGGGGGAAVRTHFVRSRDKIERACGFGVELVFLLPSLVDAGSPAQPITTNCSK